MEVSCTEEICIMFGQVIEHTDTNEPISDTIPPSDPHII